MHYRPNNYNMPSNLYHTTVGLNIHPPENEILQNRGIPISSQHIHSTHYNSLGGGNNSNSVSVANGNNSLSTAR